MIHTVQRMLKQIRYQTNHDEAEFSGSSDIEMMYLNDAQDTIFDTIADYRPDILSSNFTITLDGSSQYYIPDYIPFDYEQILLVEEYSSSDSPYAMQPTDWFDRMRYFQDDVATPRIPYSIRDNYIEFPEETDSHTARVWYVRRPVGLFYGTVAAGAASTVTFPATPTAGEVLQQDDYYNGMDVYVNGQIRRVTDYVGSTRIATVASSWDTNPTASDTVELLSPLPKRLHKLIVGVATRLIKIAQDDNDIQVERYIRDEMEKITQRLRQPHRQGPVLTRKVSRF